MSNYNEKGNEFALAPSKAIPDLKKDEKDVTFLKKRLKRDYVLTVKVPVTVSTSVGNGVLVGCQLAVDISVI